MSRDELLDHLPPIARYRREPLDDRHNALSAWEEAADGMVQFDDTRLYEDLVCENPRTGRLAAFPTGSDGRRVRQFLEDNRRTFELLRTGLDCQRLQFPEPEEDESVAEDTESISPLVHLASAWFILARSLIEEKRFAAAASELAGLGQMGQMICCGEGLVVHYLVGSSILAQALAGMRLLAAERQVSRAVLADLAAAVDRWLNTAGDVAQCLRVDLCCYSLDEIDRLAESESLESLVDELLERHYANAPVVPPEDSASDEAKDDGRLAWRRSQILHLLEGHPAPFDRTATAVLMGQEVAARILDLQPLRWFSPLGQWRRLVRSYRRSRFRYRTQLWPAQLQPGFPYEYLGPGEAARRRLEELRADLTPGQWARMQPPAEAELQAARQRLGATTNPLGWLVADALLATDITRHERVRRRRLCATKAILGAR